MPAVCTQTKSTEKKYCYVLVEYPGQDRERAVMTGMSLTQAYTALNKYGASDPPVDVMRERPDGTLTTEF